MKRLLTDVIEPQIEQIIKDSLILDDYTYHVSLDLLPGEDGPAPMLLILIAVPHPADIGRKLSAMTIVPGPIPVEGHLDAAVLGLINSVSESRTQALALP